MVSGRPPYFDQPRLNGTLQPAPPSPEVKTPPNVRAHLNTQRPRARVGRRWRVARAAAVPAPAAAAEPIDYSAARRAAARAVGSTFGAELSEGWLEDFCMDLDSSTEATATDLDVTLRVVGPGEGRRN